MTFLDLYLFLGICIGLWFITHGLYLGFERKFEQTHEHKYTEPVRKVDDIGTVYFESTCKVCGKKKRHVPINLRK